MPVNDVENLYRKYAPMVLRRCRFLLRNEASALDAMQDVFAKLLDRPKFEAISPSSYLYTVATRICLDKIRSAASRYAGGDDLLWEIAATEDFEAQIFARRLLDRLFHRQEESTRVMAVLHYLDGLTLSEVAERVGLSVSGVRKRLAGLKTHSEKLATHLARLDGIQSSASALRKEFKP
jgi:RNA polymerase sigma-70 factor, ECF subfamily